MTARHLIDTSALFRILAAEGASSWDDEILAGRVATCPIVELEFLYSATSLADRLAKKRHLATLFTSVPMTERAWERAAEVQQRLTEVGQHRSAGPADLLIAAVAEAGDLAVLTEDRDFLSIAAVTGQPVHLIGGDPLPVV